MVVMLGYNGKTFNNDNSGEFDAKSCGERTTKLT